MEPLGWADVDEPLISLRSFQSCTILANMTEDERQDLLRTVAESHASLSEVTLKLGRHLPPKAPALKTAIQTERGAFHLKHTLQQLVARVTPGWEGGRPGIATAAKGSERGTMNGRGSQPRLSTHLIGLLAGV